VIMALISTGYTFVGGLKAVVWTDVAQGTIFFVGASTALVVGLLKLDLPFSQVVSEAAQAGKLQLFDLSSNPFTSTQSLWGALVGGFFLVLASHGTDQENVQHMLNTRSEKSSGRTVFSSGFAAFPIVALFLSVGSMLWVYHRHRTPSGYGFATNEEIKRIFPNFIMHELPVGVRGLVFAGLFAAAISSLGATLNAATAAWTHDIRPRPAERPASLLFVRCLIFVFGIVLAAVGLFFAWFARDAHSDLVQIALSAMTILYGAILGTFLLALFVEKRGSDRSALLGLGAGVAVGAVLFFQKQIFGLESEFLAWPWRLPLAAGIAVAVGLCGRRRRELI
jgi:SSS family solute:Na+ symporter